MSWDRGGRCSDALTSLAFTTAAGGKPVAAAALRELPTHRAAYQ